MRGAVFSFNAGNNIIQFIEPLVACGHVKSDALHFIAV
jgi:hypothetical protein